MEINAYHMEHAEAFRMVGSPADISGVISSESLNGLVDRYIGFRADVDRFFTDYFSDICTDRCFRNNVSACCSREGIIAFFADVAINVMQSSETEIAGIMSALSRPNQGSKCVYLGQNGCLWRVKPIVCQMFLCDFAKETVFLKDQHLESVWGELKDREQFFKWPDHPTLFDAIEYAYIRQGFDSPLMYLHKSPGLLMVKRRAGLKAQSL